MHPTLCLYFFTHPVPLTFSPTLSLISTLFSSLPFSTTWHTQPSPHSSLLIPSSFLLLDAIFGSDSGQMYRSSVPFRANDPLLQVPYTATPPYEPYPPLLCHTSSTHCMLYYRLLHYCILINSIAYYSTTLHSIPLYATILYCTFLQLFFALIYTATQFHLSLSIHSSLFLILSLLLFFTFHSPLLYLPCRLTLTWVW